MKDEAEMLKDIISLSNSSVYYNNYSFLIIGIEEENFKIKEFEPVNNIAKIEQKIVFLMQNYLNKSPNFDMISVPLNEIYQWRENNEIPKSIPIDSMYSDDNNNEIILIIKFKRQKGQIYEIHKEIHFKKKSKNRTRYPGSSWIRISSHSFRLLEYQRKIMRLQ